MLNGDWQVGSELKWPYQPLPPKPFWATFRRCLRRSFCSLAPAASRAHYFIDLDVPLGGWYSVCRNTWFSAYHTGSELYWRRCDDATLHVMTKSNVTGFYNFSHTTTELPVQSHPIRFQQTGDSLWSLHKYHPCTTQEAARAPPGHIISNMLVDPSCKVVNSKRRVRPPRSKSCHLCMDTSSG